MGYFDSINKKKISMEDTREKLKIQLQKDVIQMLEKEFIDMPIDLRNNITWFCHRIMDKMVSPHTRGYEHKYYLLKENPFGGNTDVLFDFDPNLYDDFPHDVNLNSGLWGVNNLGKFHMSTMRTQTPLSIEPQLSNSGGEIKVIIPWTMDLTEFYDPYADYDLSTYIKRTNQKLLNDYRLPISIKDFLIKLLHTEPYNCSKDNKVDFVTVQKEIIKMIEKTMSHQPALEHIGIQIPVKCEIPIYLSSDLENQLNYLTNQQYEYSPCNFTGPVTSHLITIQ